MAIRIEDTARKVNFDLTCLPSGRGLRVGVFLAILLFLVLFFPTGTPLLVDVTLLQRCCPGGTF